jgi:type VI protein secretion system component VasK
MGLVKKGTIVACAAFVAVVIAACGSSNSLLSSDQAATLNHQLAQAKAALADKSCDAANRYVNDFENTVSGLGNVNSNLSSALNNGAQKLSTLMTRDCAVKQPAKTTTKSTTTQTKSTTTQTKTTPTQTKSTPTQTATTPTTPTTPQTTTSPNNGGGGLGGGNGGGSGGGNGGGSSTTGGGGL